MGASGVVDVQPLLHGGRFGTACLPAYLSVCLFWGSSDKAQGRTGGSRVGSVMFDGIIQRCWRRLLVVCAHAACGA